MNKFLLKICGRGIMSVRGLAFVGIIVLTNFFGASATLEAAPVIFAFEAEITGIVPSADVGFSLPPEIVVGGVFNGLVTFEPPAFFGRDSDGASLQTEIGSVAFTATDLPFITIDDPGVFSGNSFSYTDMIQVGCIDISAEPCQAGASNIPSLMVSKFGLGFVDSTFPAINPLFDRLENPDVWNRFPVRRLVIEFTSESSIGFYQVIAEVGPVSVIPEPSALCQALLAVIGITCGVNRRKHLREIK